MVSMYTNITASLVHVLIAVPLSAYGDWGILGVSIASSVHFFVRFIVIICYIKFSGKFDDPEQQVSLRDPECFKLWKGQFIQSL